MAVPQQQPSLLEGLGGAFNQMRQQISEVLKPKEMAEWSSQVSSSGGPASWGTAPAAAGQAPPGGVYRTGGAPAYAGQPQQPQQGGYPQQQQGAGQRAPRGQAAYPGGLVLG